jgi:putative flavoprotein involved in K+ transport
MNIDTVIVGAGQNGLATAYELRKRGRVAVVLHEHPRVGDQWRKRYTSLRLNTPAQYASLPGMRFPAPSGTFPAGADLGDYLEAYARNMGIDVRDRTNVTGVTRLDDGTFRVDTDDETFFACNVVIATGSEHHPKLPEFADDLDPSIRQVHSTAYRDPGQLLAGPVLVVGAGQSGADLALEIRRAGHDTWLAGKESSAIPFELEGRVLKAALPVLWFVWNRVLTTKNPVGRRLQTVVRSTAAPLLRVKPAHLDAAGVRRIPARVVGTESGLPRLADGTVLDVRNVVWCTGYRRDFSYISPSVTGASGWPRDDGGVMHDVPGLYFVGLLFQRGFYSMLIGGAGRDAAFIAEHIANRQRVTAEAVAAVSADV